ncbi:MAG: DUF72 domain-containing protein [Planctomycetaceae bacterium]|nr:DUF72 domain-containing protein [Planctomycetales bacterium]MCB9926820.1 DUF72 domain-containing protein [Planctomycetaceae bacterium]
MTTGTLTYYLGCPVWACDKWKGTLYTSTAPHHSWLSQYASVFGTVEGNSTFYGLPSLETVRRWAESVPAGFRFALKFPRTISHDLRLLNAQAETQRFLDVLAVLHEAGCLGPSFLQLPRGFSPHHLGDLAEYLHKLPRDFPYAVEVRHREFFDEASHESALDDLLTELHIDRVIFDSRALFSAPPNDSFEVESQRRKPNLPVHQSITWRHPILRFVGRNELERNLPWIHEWALKIAGWMKAGLHPFVFTHCPDERFAPQFARMFHDELTRHVEVAEMPRWPGEVEPHPPKQMELF